MDIMRPRYITFDCYGTLTNFQMGPLAREVFADRIRDPDRMAAFCADFSAYRFDEVLGAWRPYEEVVKASVERTCRRWNVPYTPDDGQRFYDAVPSWGPHPDVTEGLARIAHKIPLVIYSNAAEEQIMANVEKLGVPFAHVFTAERFKTYKPRLAAFEAMIDTLDCAPTDLLHVSSSFRYDLFSAALMGIENKAFVNRGHEPYTPGYGATKIADIGALPALVGL
ncbi:haloacid dehalogenase type II [Salinisphaera hydrothermalis]|uniref:haloacid dehalogenase type II n=1 Tax=Salinisphaera hydrothermalis TaxID=563188 RepID=UPI00333F2059